MGTSKRYLASGGFSQQDYEQLGTTANGIKIIAEKATGRSSIPKFSNTPGTMYAKLSKQTNLVKQITVFGKGADGRGKLKDIDIEHTHTNKGNGKKFSKTDIHVHDYDENGHRSEEARKPSKKERRLIMVARYGKRQDK